MLVQNTPFNFPTTLTIFSAVYPTGFCYFISPLDPNYMLHTVVKVKIEFIVLITFKVRPTELALQCSTSTSTSLRLAVVIKYYDWAYLEQSKQFVWRLSFVLFLFWPQLSRLQNQVVVQKKRKTFVLCPNSKIAQFLFERIPTTFVYLFIITSLAFVQQ